MDELSKNISLAKYAERSKIISFAERLDHFLITLRRYFVFTHGADLEAAEYLVTKKVDKKKTSKIFTLLMKKNFINLKALQLVCREGTRLAADWFYELFPQNATPPEKNIAKDMLDVFQRELQALEHNLSVTLRQLERFHRNGFFLHSTICEQEYNDTGNMIFYHEAINASLALGQPLQEWVLKIMKNESDKVVSTAKRWKPNESNTRDELSCIFNLTSRTKNTSSFKQWQQTRRNRMIYHMISVVERVEKEHWQHGQENKFSWAARVLDHSGVNLDEKTIQTIYYRERKKEQQMTEKIMQILSE